MQFFVKVKVTKLLSIEERVYVIWVILFFSDIPKDVSSVYVHEYLCHVRKS